MFRLRLPRSLLPGPLSHGSSVRCRLVPAAVSLIDVQVRERKIDVGITGQPEWLEQLEYEPAFIEQHRQPVHVRQGGDQAGLGVGHDVVDHTQIECPTQGLPGTLDNVLKRLQVGKQLDRAAVNFFALRGQGESGSPAPAQLQAQSAFQRREVAADRRQAGAQPVGGGGNAAVLDNGEKSAQVPDVVVRESKAAHQSTHLQVPTSKLTTFNLHPQQSVQ